MQLKHELPNDPKGGVLEGLTREWGLDSGLRRGCGLGGHDGMRQQQVEG